MNGDRLSTSVNPAEITSCDSRPLISQPSTLKQSLALLAFVLIGEITATAQTNPTPASVLRFHSGERLHGSLQGLDSRDGLSWQNPDASAPIRFATTNLALIQFENTPRNVEAPKADGLVKLRNQDEFPGNLIGFDTEKFTFETWHAGKVTLPLEKVQSVNFAAARRAMIFQGPAGPEGWTFTQVGNQPWKYRDNAFFTSNPASLGRDFKLPPSVRIQFDLAWRGQFSLVMSLYTDNINNLDYRSSFYLVQIGSGYVHAQRIQAGAPGAQLGDARVEGLSTKTKARFEFRIDTQKGNLFLFIDGAQVLQMRDPVPFKGMGRGVLFASQLNNAWIKVSDMEITEWDGRTEESATVDLKKGEVLLRLANHDRLTGRLDSVQGNKLAVITPKGKLEIPLDRITHLELGGGSTNPPTANSRAVRGYFTGRGSITMELDRWDSQKVVGRSPDFGALEFRPDAFRMLQFNLARPMPSDDDFEPSAPEAITLISD
ncbi:MAG: hypothetical protein H7X97_13810 [Opitutaceae bacterium]|nr:hypothetical protein [Verrucomicrobiales bacterium]